MKPEASDWALDTSRPWLSPYATHVERASAAVSRGDGVAQALASGIGEPIGLPGGPLRFVPANEAPGDEAYEAFIFRCGCVPTRDNLHDFFNGIVWLHWPKAKRRLNELHAAELARTGVGATRGPLRDALTVFDESGAVLDAPPALWRALFARDWQTLFVTRRALWDEARLLLFGHALLEKLTVPRKAITAHVLYAPGAVRSIAPDDAAIAAALEPDHLRAKPFVPLPVLGVPGWWVPNESPSFYDDASVFRPQVPKSR
ncbi:MAG: DUF3025 domain-containing protein [Gammaproteobacteria bacterium]|nr:DUF3025 domain-containing protein [Gammaproteobacteria bacterium]MBU1440851.1 DUF3025 domain-containing protein [Gammaproteobacteria bacterium]MBU2285854.1 DUF3025 domain-containing protein [Gammaproteobacteria bacterium]